MNTFNQSSITEKAELYKKGKLIQETFFYPSGTPREQISYQGNDKAKNVTCWYENGSPKAIESYDASDKLAEATYYDPRHHSDSSVIQYEGMRLSRDAYGQIISKDTIQGGMTILRTTFYPNGTPKEIIPFTDGKIAGIKKTYLPDGEPRTIETWVDGRQEGLIILFANGQRYTEFMIKNGMKEGMERRYRDGTVLVEEINWKADQRDGESISHLGEVPKSEWFFKGQPTTKVNYELLSQGVLR